MYRNRKIRNIFAPIYSILLHCAIWITIWIRVNMIKWIKEFGDVLWGGGFQEELASHAVILEVKCLLETRLEQRMWSVCQSGLQASRATENACFFFFILFLTCWDFFHCDLDMFWWDSLKLQRSVDWRNKWMERSGLVCGVSRMVRWANQCSVEQVLILTFKQPAAAKHTLTVTDRSCKQRKVKKTGWICRCKKRKKKGA